MPLHVLCSSQALLGAFKYLVDSYPASLTAQTQNGELPVMLARESSSLNVVYYLLRRSPQVLRQPPNVR